MVVPFREKKTMNEQPQSRPPGRPKTETSSTNAASKPTTRKADSNHSKLSRHKASNQKVGDTALQHPSNEPTFSDFFILVCRDNIL